MLTDSLSDSKEHLNHQDTGNGRTQDLMRVAPGQDVIIRSVSNLPVAGSPERGGHTDQAPSIQPVQHEMMHSSSARLQANPKPSAYISFVLPWAYTA